MALSIREKYADMFKSLANLSVAAAKIDETNVYQKENPQTRKFMDKLVEDNMAEGSRLEGKENFRAFLDAVKSGKHGLILMEHYSNTDLPALCYLLEHDLGEEGKDLSKRIVAIAGMKLNEANPLVRAFAESFTRVVIYPTRSLTKAEEKAQSEEEKLEEENSRAKFATFVSRAQDIMGGKLFISKIEDINPVAIKIGTEFLSQKLGESIIVLANNKTVVAKVSESFVKRGIQAGQIVGEIARATGANGGGRPNFAQGGIKDASKLNEILAKIEEDIKG